jgi:uncharacterized protein (TIGR02270 family)
LARFDDRLVAHLDGLNVAGEGAWPLIGAGLQAGSPSAAFVATVRAIQDKHQRRLDNVFALTRAVPEMRAGLLRAVGWVEAVQLRATMLGMRDSEDPPRRLAYISACGMHRVDPGLASGRWLNDSDPQVRARAWRTVGELGMHDLRSVAAAAIDDKDPACKFWAAWSAVLLGAKGRALDLLKQAVVSDGSVQARAFRLAIQAMTVGEAHALLQPLAEDLANIRTTIRGAGFAGDPVYVRWLIGFMANDTLARLAGESFSLITGLDLAWLDLERKPPENFESGPNDDPEDPNVEMDEDDGLPWPDQAKIQAWWTANSHRFQPGVRYFMGEPLNRENCVRVLKEGFQRQRILAAHYLSLLNPGTVLFNTSAPAWRQQRLLSQMT